jgi:hypothetical protein
MESGIRIARGLRAITSVSSLMETGPYCARPSSPRSRAAVKMYAARHGFEQAGASQSLGRCAGRLGQRAARCRPMAGEPAISGSTDPDHRSELHSVSDQHRQGRAARLRHALVGRAGLVRRRPLPVVERYPEQPDHEVGGGNRSDQRVPQAFEFRQRQYARSTGSAGDLRAWHPARHAHGIRRVDRPRCRFVRRQAPQFTQ